MKYYSEKTNEKYDTEAECLEAESKFDEAERAKRAEERQRAEMMERINDAYGNYCKLCDAYYERYHVIPIVKSDRNEPIQNMLGKILLNF